MLAFGYSSYFPQSIPLSIMAPQLIGKISLNKNFFENIAVFLNRSLLSLDLRFWSENVVHKNKAVDYLKEFRDQT